MYKIIATDQKEYGPVTADQIRQWITEGRVNAQSRAMAEGAMEWKPLAAFPEFAGALPAAPPAAGAPWPVPPGALRPIPKTSGMAIASLVLGVLGVFSCGATALVGLILGIIAMSKIRQSKGILGGGGIALAGTVVSAVFLFMLPMLAAMLLPALAKAKQKAQTIVCVNNMKQLSVAVRIYASDHKDQFPPAATWCDAIFTDAGAATKLFQCPAGDHSKRSDYAFNAKLSGMDEKQVAPNTVLFFETDGGWNVSGGPELMLKQPRHGKTFVVAFADGSVQMLDSSALAALKWSP
jgi:prepilin-type processing-associated H-X9-DG protein